MPEEWKNVTSECRADGYDIKHGDTFLGDWIASAAGYRLRKIRVDEIHDETLGAHHAFIVEQRIG